MRQLCNKQSPYVLFYYNLLIGQLHNFVILSDFYIFGLSLVNTLWYISFQSLCGEIFYAHKRTKMKVINMALIVEENAVNFF